MESKDEQLPGGVRDQRALTGHARRQVTTSITPRNRREGARAPEHLSRSVPYPSQGPDSINWYGWPPVPGLQLSASLCIPPPQHLPGVLIMRMCATPASFQMSATRLGCPIHRPLQRPRLGLWVGYLFNISLLHSVLPSSFHLHFILLYNPLYFIPSSLVCGSTRLPTLLLIPKFTIRPFAYLQDSASVSRSPRSSPYLPYCPPRFPLILFLIPDSMVRWLSRPYAHIQSRSFLSSSTPSIPFNPPQVLGWNRI